VGIRQRLFVAVLLGAVSAGDLVAAPARAGDSCPAGQTRVLNIADATAPGGTRSIWVHGPAGVDDASIPVVYYLHGFPGGISDVSGLGALLDHETCLGHRPVVLAAPDGTVNGGLDTEWGDDARGRFALESFVTGRLVSAVEGAHVRDVRNRALIGFSMGGFAAVSLGMRHRIYGRVAALVGYFKVDDPERVFGSRAVFHDPAHLLGRAHGLPILLEDAAGDDEPLTAGEAVRFAAVLRSRGLPVTLRVRDGAHSGSFVGAQLPSVLRWLGGGWPS
jgi:S-formylglutathione hydrolase FrmB